jgi:hypothetical protein
VRTARKVCTHNLAPRQPQAGEVRALSSWPAARSTAVRYEDDRAMTTDEKLRARARKAQAKPFGDHRIATAEFTALTARIACSCGMSVTHTGADRRRIVDRFHVHQQAARDAEPEAVRRATPGGWLPGFVDDDGRPHGPVPTPATGQGGGDRFTEVRRIETLAGPAELLGLPRRRVPRTTASRKRRT